MISHKHKSIFVHIPKAAGTSIEMSFLKDLNLDERNRHALLIGLNTNEKAPRRVSHLTASQMVNDHFISHELFESYFKFAFVRHPVSRLFSTYRYFQLNKYMSFDSFIQNKLNEFFENTHRNHYFLMPQYNYVYDNQGKLLVDFVGKLENIEDDFDFIKNKIGGSRLTLPHFNQSKKKKLKPHVFLRKIWNDRKYLIHFSFSKHDKNLSEASKNKIIELYSMDFKAFDYNTEF